MDVSPVNNMDLNAIFTALQGGGNIALMVCVYFIRDASQRLARLEKALDVALADRITRERHYNAGRSPP